MWFGIIERQAIRRGSFRSVRDLNAKIRAFIDGWNDRYRPFVWTKTADQILKKANRQTTSNTRCSAKSHFTSSAAEQYQGKFKLVGLNLSGEPYGVGLKKGDTKLRDDINAAIEQMVSDGSWQEYFDADLGKSGFTTEPPDNTEK